jgi:hypothetical protein
MMPRNHTFEGATQPCERFDAVEFRGFDEGGDDRLPVGAALTAGEQGIFTTQCDGANGALDRIGIEVDPSIVEKPD